MNWGDSGQGLRKQGRRQGIPFVCAFMHLSQETFSNKKVNWRWELDASVMTARWRSIRGKFRKGSMSGRTR